MPQRYFVSQLNHVIEGQDAHHIRRVMRMKIGDEIVLCADRACHLAKIVTLDPEVTYQIISTLPSPKTLDVTLIQGMPKHPKGDFVVKYATVFGVSKILFVTMHRSVVKMDKDSNKLNRYHMIAKETSELAHRFFIPEITFVQKLSLIDWKAYDQIILADEEESKETLKPWLETLDPSLRIAIIIGPEGGISAEERTELIRLGAHPVTLGTHILPTESAALYLLSVLYHHFL